MTRHIFITGGANGIGEAIVHRFYEEGTFITIADMNEQRSNEVAADIRNAGGNICVAIGDVRDKGDVERMVKTARETFGPIDVLVNDAGIYPAAPLANITDIHYNEIMDTNIKGIIYCTQKIVPDMITRKQGWIVSLASCDGIFPGPNNSVYSASKAAVISMTRAWAHELAPHNIRVNAVAPGWVGTKTVLSNDRWKAGVKLVPLRRLAETNEIASVVAFLCSKDASYITGEVININGGLIMN